MHLLTGSDWLYCQVFTVTDEGYICVCILAGVGYMHWYAVCYVCVCVGVCVCVCFMLYTNMWQKI